MAYGDSRARFWEADLTTRTGARGAAQQGGLACFVFAALGVFGAVLLGGMAGYGTAEGIASMAGAGVEVVIALIAGFRLRAGKGAWWGMVVAALMVLEIAVKVASFSLGGVIIPGILLVMLVQGVRGALALKKNLGFEDDDIEVFN